MSLKQLYMEMNEMGRERAVQDGFHVDLERDEQDNSQVGSERVGEKSSQVRFKR